MRRQGDDRQHDREHEQQDDNPLEHLHAPGGRAVGHLRVDPVERLEFARDARIPFVQVETARREGVDPREELIADELQRVGDLLEQYGGVELEARETAQVRADRREQPGTARPRDYALVGTFQDIVQLVIEKAQKGNRRPLIKKRNVKFGVRLLKDYDFINGFGIEELGEPL